MYKELIKKAKENNLEQFQIQEVTIEDLSVSIFNENLDKFETSKITQYKITANYQGKEVKINTEYIDDTIFDLLKEQARLLDVKTPISRKKLQDITEKEIYNISNPEPIIKELLELNNLKEKYPLLKEITCQYGETIIERRIITETNELYDTKLEKYFYFEVLVSENDKISTSYEIKKKIGNDTFNMKEIAEKIINKALDKLYYKEIPAGNYNVILTSKVMGEILNRFIPIFSAEKIQKDTSLLVGKKEQKIFSDKITIIEDPSNKTFFGKRLFDDAGIKTEYKEIVKNGIFTQIIYDEKTALMDKTNPTGNDYGEISVRNLYIKSGQTKLEQLIQSQDKAIIIDEVVGIDAGVNLTNGDISLQAEGYYIENGEMKYASKLFILSTNIMDILNNVVDISNNLEFYLETAASPDLLIANIKIVK